MNLVAITFLRRGLGRAQLGRAGSRTVWPYMLILTWSAPATTLQNPCPGHVPSSTQRLACRGECVCVCQPWPSACEWRREPRQVARTHLRLTQLFDYLAFLPCSYQSRQQPYLIINSYEFNYNLFPSHLKYPEKEVRSAEEQGAGRVFKSVVLLFQFFWCIGPLRRPLTGLRRIFMAYK